MPLTHYPTLFNQRLPAVRASMLMIPYLLHRRQTIKPHAMVFVPAKFCMVKAGLRLLLS